MPQPRWLLLSVFFAFAGPAFGQTVSFLDAQGSAASVYFEGSRAFLRVEDPAANTNSSTAEYVLVNVSAALSGDTEQAVLDETGPDTGVFTGWLQLQLNGMVGSGLITSQDASTYPDTFDTLTATYGAATDTAGTVGSTVSVLDASGNDISSFVVGDTVYFRVQDALANTSPGVDTTQVDVYATVRTWGEYQPVYLTETGGDTGVFEGSVPTVYGIDPIQHDGVFELEPGDELRAVHDDANGETSSSDTAMALSDLPVTITFLDWDFATDQPISEIHEFSYFQIRATDGAATGQGSMTVRVSSDLRGDEEWVTLWEDAENAGTFYGALGVFATMSSNPPAADGFMEVTEIPGPPHQFDTLRATPEACSVSPCPTAVAGVIGSSVRFLDSQGEDAETFSAGDTVTLEVRDHAYYGGPTTATLVSQSGDSETVSVLSYNPYTGLYRGSIACEEGPPVPGDGVLQVQEPDTITASHLDPLGFSSSTDIATVGSENVIFLDRFGNPTDFQFEWGWVRVQARNSDANLSPGTADTLAATLQTVDINSNVRDSEPLQLTETGPDTGVFTGQMEHAVQYYPQPNDGVIGSFYTFVGMPPAPPDTLTAIVGTASVTVPLLGSKIWFIDANGADATQYSAGGRIYVRLESEEFNFNPAIADTAYVQLVNLSNSDFEYPLLAETGPDTSIFEGWYDTNVAPPGWDGVFNVQPGDTIQAVDNGGYGPNTTDEAGIITPPSPDAVDDAASLAEDGPAVSIPVLANDTAPEGRTLTISAVTQGTRGTAAIQGDGTITYTPNANANGADSFTYAVTDSLGLTDTATVSITISAVNDLPVAVADAVSVEEEGTVLISVLANDTDADGDTLSLGSSTHPQYGYLVSTGDGFLYSPTLGYHGTDSFTYTARDAQGESLPATVTITVTPVNDAPVAEDDAASTSEDTAVIVAVLANDSDLDGDSLSVASVTQGTYGVAVINADNTLTYTPNANASGRESFTYTVSDGNGGSDTATVALSILAVNDAPDAVNDSASTNEDAAVTVSVLTNDTDLEGDSLSVASVTQGTRGVAVINGDGTVTYTPNANANGPDSFTYTISDGNGGSDTATVSITISAANDVPDAVNDSASTNEDAAVTVAVLTNDTDLDGDNLSVASVTQGTRGVAVINGDSTITYTPNADANGSDSFTYTISDGNGGSDTATVSITVSAANDAPDAVNDSASTNEDAAVTVSVLTNDTDLDGDNLSVASVTQGTRGVAVINGDGTVTYTPNADANGSDSFTYTISDGNGGSDTATVSITISAANDAPDAVNDSASTNEDAAVTVSVLTNDTDLDGDSLSVASVTQGTHGVAVINGDGTVTYTPNADANGSDSFTYNISDGNGGSDTATVSITISAANDVLDAVNDSASTNEDAAVTVSVLTNDTDLDGDSLSVASVTQGTRGVAVINANGTITYTPNANANGADSFTYTVSDGNGGSDTATVSITIAAVNDAPDAINDAAATNEDVAVTISVLANDSDPEGHSLAITAVTQGTNGAVSINGNGTVTYTPGLNFNGSDSFSYTISDGNGGSDSATVSVTVVSANDPPDAVNDAATTREGVAVTITVLGNDTDLEGNALSVSSVGTPNNGTAAVNGNNTVTYTPGANFAGTASFTYTIGDGQGGADSATVTVTVKEALERVVLLATNSAYFQSSADVLSGDVVVNQAGPGPYLNGGVELSIAGTVTTPAGWDVQADSVTIGSGATVASDLFYNQLTNNGTVTGPQTTPLTLPVIVPLPTLLTGAPGSSDVVVSNNGTHTLAPGNYRDLIVGRNATVTFTGGNYRFRGIQVERDSKLYFSAASEVRIQLKLVVRNNTTVAPATGSSITAANIVFHINGVNGSSGGLTAAPQAFETGTDCIFRANVYAPNGTALLRDRTQATGAFFARDVWLGTNTQVTLQSAWTGM